MQVDRTGLHRTVVPVKIKKDTSWQIRIFEECVECLSTGQIPNPEVSAQCSFLILGSLILNIF